MHNIWRAALHSILSAASSWHLLWNPRAFTSLVAPFSHLMATHPHFSPLLMEIWTLLPTASLPEGFAWACPDPKVCSALSNTMSKNATGITWWWWDELHRHWFQLSSLLYAITTNVSTGCHCHLWTYHILSPRKHGLRDMNVCLAMALMPDNSAFPSQSGNVPGSSSYTTNLRYLSLADNWAEVLRSQCFGRWCFISTSHVELNI